MFMKCGCGCVVLVVNSESFRAKSAWTVRLIEDCRGDYESYAPIIGKEVPLSQIVDTTQIEKSRCMTPEECKPYLDRMAELLIQGHKLTELARMLKGILS